MHWLALGQAECQHRCRPFKPHIKRAAVKPEDAGVTEWDWKLLSLA